MSMLLENEVSRSVAASVNENVERGGAGLCVEREDIEFHNVAPDRLRIEVTVHNRLDVASRPETMRLQFAAFGAFVPWTPLQELRVPRIRAGGSRLVSTEVMIRENGSLVAIDGRARSADRPYSAALRELDRDRAVLRVIRRDKQFRSMSVWQVMARIVQEQLGEGVSVRKALSDTEAAERLKLNVLNRIRAKVFFDYMEFSRSTAGVLGAPGAEAHRQDPNTGRSVHWIGNINVLIGDKDVERHMAQALRIYPGVANRCVFFLGDKAGESYSFELKGPGAEWVTKLSMLERPWGFRYFAGGYEGPWKQIQPGDWLGVEPRGQIGIEISPPGDATEGGLSIEVCRKSDKRGAVVEFDFSESAAGTGCYTVDGS